MNGSKGPRPQEVPQRVDDPQEQELRVGTLTRVPLNQAHQHQEPSTHARQWARPTGSADVVPQPSMLKGYHDIVEDMVVKKLKQMALD